MKKPALKFGVASGVLYAAMFMATLLFAKNNGETAVAYTISKILLIGSLSMIFLAIRQTRDRLMGGVISFNIAFRTGMVVVLLSTACYTLTKVGYSSFIDKDFVSRSIDETVTAEDKRIDEMKDLTADQKTKMKLDFSNNMEDLRNPYAFALTSILDVFPIGFAIALLCAVLMKKP
ncbi:MAG: DUF4199 domain-containing protein [Bacteroidota bacterium]